MNITQYVTIYAPWEEGQDEPRKIQEWTVEHDMDSVDDAVDALQKEGATNYSSYPDWQTRGWYSTETYTHSYSGEMEESSYHLDGLTEDESREIHRRITA